MMLQKFVPQVSYVCNIISDGLTCWKWDVWKLFWTQKNVWFKSCAVAIWNSLPQNFLSTYGKNIAILHISNKILVLILVEFTMRKCRRTYREKAVNVFLPARLLFKNSRVLYLWPQNTIKNIFQMTWSSQFNRISYSGSKVREIVYKGGPNVFILLRLFCPRSTSPELFYLHICWPVVQFAQSLCDSNVSACTDFHR